jgi:hypothetical protein
MTLGIGSMISYTWRSHSAIDKAWKENDRHVQPMKVTLHEKGLIYQAALYRTAYRWALFTEVVETPTLFLLYSGPSTLRFMIPKRAITNPADMNKLKLLLDEKISPPTGGFPVLPGNAQS